MKQMLRRMLALGLCLALCVAAACASMPTASAKNSNGVLLAYVPLDDRPVVYDRMIYAGQAAGFDIRTPEYDDIRTRLDGQGVNENGTQHGDGGDIMDWLEEMEQAGCNHYIIHLDMMLSGGLVGSRHPDSATVTDEELDIMDRLIKISQNPENKVYFIDIVMRLASTSGYKGYQSAAYDAFRNYGAKERKTLDSSGFGTTDYNTSVGQLQTIYNNYQTAPDGSKITFKSALTQADINGYHDYRLRKMTLMNIMIQYAGAGTTYMVGIDDSSPGNTIQTNELNFLDARLKAMGLDYVIMYDTDSCGLMMLARLVNDYYNTQPKLKVRYFGTQADAIGDEYSNDTLRQNVQKHIKSMNAVEVSDGAEIEVFVLTQPTTDFTSTGVEDEDYKNAILSMVSEINHNLNKQIPTVVIDASRYSLQAWNWYFTNLQDEFMAQVTDIGRLLGYSNWNTVGNSVGIALGVGMSRYTYLRHSDQISEASHTAHVQSMTFSYIKDITYNMRNKANEYVGRGHDRFMYWLTKNAGTDGTGWNTANFYTDMVNYKDSDSYYLDWELCRGERYVNNNLEWFMFMGGDANAYGGCGTQVLNMLKDSTVYTDLNGTAQTRGIGDVSLARFRFPWYRGFEITFDIYASLESSVQTFYQMQDSCLVGLPAKTGYADFVASLQSQYGTSGVTVKNLSGNTATSGVIGTGFAVTMPLDGSSVMMYAVVKGDLDGDAAVNTSDARRCMLKALDAATLTNAQTKAADVDKNNAVTTNDARLILLQAVTS